MTKKMSTEQYRYMVQFFEKNPNVAKNKVSIQFNKKHLDAAWGILSKNLNSIRGAKKDPKEWRRTWSDLKYSVRQKASKNESLEGRLAELERRVLNILGWQSGKEDAVQESALEYFNTVIEEEIPIQIDSPVIQSTSGEIPEIVIEAHPYPTLQQDIDSSTQRPRKKRKKEDITMQNIAVELIEFQNEILSEISASLGSSSEFYKKQIEIAERKLELEEKIAIRKLEFQEITAMRQLEMQQKIAERKLELKKREVAAAERKASALEKIAMYKEKKGTITNVI